MGIESVFLAPSAQTGADILLGTELTAEAVGELGGSLLALFSSGSVDGIAPTDEAASFLQTLRAGNMGKLPSEQRQVFVSQVAAYMARIPPQVWHQFQLARGGVSPHQPQPQPQHQKYQRFAHRPNPGFAVRGTRADARGGRAEGLLGAAQRAEASGNMDYASQLYRYAFEHASSAPPQNSPNLVKEAKEGITRVAVAAVNKFFHTPKGDTSILSMNAQDLIAILENGTPPVVQIGIVMLKAQEVLRIFNQIGDDNIIGRGGLHVGNVERARRMLEHSAWKGPVGGLTKAAAFRRLMEIEAVIKEPVVHKSRGRKKKGQIDFSVPVSEFSGVTDDAGKWAVVEREIQSIQTAHPKRFSRKVADDIGGSVEKRYFTPEEAMQLVKHYRQALESDANQIRSATESGRIAFTVTNVQNFIRRLNELIHNRASSDTPASGIFEGTIPDDFRTLSSENQKWDYAQRRADESAERFPGYTPRLLLDIASGKRDPALSGLLTAEEAWAYIANHEREITNHGLSGFNLAVQKELDRRKTEETIRLARKRNAEEVLRDALALRGRLAPQIDHGNLPEPLKTEAREALVRLDAAITRQDAEAASRAIGTIDRILRNDRGMPVRLRSGGRPLGDGNKHWKGGS